MEIFQRASRSRFIHPQSTLSSLTIKTLSSFQSLLLSMLALLGVKSHSKLSSSITDLAKGDYDFTTDYSNFLGYIFWYPFPEDKTTKIKWVLAKEDFEPISLTYFTENKNRKVLVPLMKVSVSAQGWEVRLVPMGTTITATLDFLCGSWYKSIRNVHRNCN